MKLLYIFLIFVTLINAQIRFQGKCPDFKVKQPFDSSRYLGKWYEAEKYFVRFEVGGKCITATYTDEGDGVIGVLNRQLNIASGNETTIKGTAALAGVPDEAKLSVVFPSIPFGRPAPYWVLETDYENFSIVYSCTNFEDYQTTTLWILTRQRFPCPAVIREARWIIGNYGLKRSLLMKTDQRNCPADH
ncbi:apolipoprotein D-like [Arctopsyche grandis]|uniref:apolipoprotein D-like n=1 Tax=Arctopsyche grandis TaxID=121162 RepID=UPI00406D8C4A